MYYAEPFYADGSPVMEPDAGRKPPDGKVGRPICREARDERRAFLSARSAWVSASAPDLAPERGSTIRLNGEVVWRYDLIAAHDPETGAVMGRLDWVDLREERRREAQAALDAEARKLLGVS